MTSSPKVSIVVPVYNRADLIIETLNSAVNQTYKNIEIIVVDNKSTDNSYELVQKFAQNHPNVKVFQNEENIGPVRNWKKSVGYASSEYVKILWSDDLIAPTFVEKTLPYLTDHEDVGFIYTGATIFIDNLSSGIKKETYYVDETGIHDTKKFIEGLLISMGYPVSPGNAIFRKKDLDKNILLDVPNSIGSDFKSHAVGTDMLTYLLTAKDYPKYGFLSESLAFFRQHADSISGSDTSANKVTLYEIAKAYYVDKYVNEKGLEKKFDTRLVWNYMWRLRKNSVGLNSFKDFYPEQHKFRLDYKFLATYIIKKAISIESYPRLLSLMLQQK